MTNSLCHRSVITKKGELFGKLFEHFIILEIRAFLSYSRKNLSLNHWRSTSQMEVDLVIGGKTAIEIKAVQLVQDKHLRGIRALKEEKLMKKHLVISLDENVRKTKDNIAILPWTYFLDQLWKGKIVF